MYTLRIWSISRNWWIDWSQYSDLDTAVNCCDKWRMQARVVLTATGETLYQND